MLRPFIVKISVLGKELERKLYNIQYTFPYIENYVALSLIQNTMMVLVLMYI